LLAMAYRGLGDQENGKAHLAQSGSVGVRVDDPIEKELENLLQGERTHMVRGRLAFNAGRYQESIQEFRQALAARPDSCGARVNLASALASAGKVDEALSEYEAAAGPCPDSAVLHFNLGRLYLEKGILDKAFEEYRRSLELNPNDLAALLALAQISTRQEAVDQAAEYLSTAVGMHPDSEEAWYELSGFLLGRKEYARARDRLEEACGRLPTAGRLVELLARLLAACPDLSLRNGARAIELAERVYAAAPTVYHAETLALALAETGRCEEAAAVLQKSIPVLEESGKYPDLLARMRKDLQRYRQGQPCRPPE
jgi:tetratricopeptide (TPR) repeat protein